MPGPRIIARPLNGALPRPRSRARPLARSALPAALLLALALAAQSSAAGHVREFLDFAAGVLALVSLTAAVMWGLAATDRLMLSPVHRLLAQGVHRCLGVLGLAFLGLHIWVKSATGQADGTAVFLPFTDARQPLLVGLGTLAGYVFVAVALTGAARSAFTTRTGSRWWRALHMAAYVAWGAALVHGLKTGRHASGWVTAGYALCTGVVLVALALRFRGPRGVRS